MQTHTYSQSQTVFFRSSQGTRKRKPGPNWPVVDLLYFLAAWWEMFWPD